MWTSMLIVQKRSMTLNILSCSVIGSSEGIGCSWSNGKSSATATTKRGYCNRDDPPPFAGLIA